MSYSVDCPCGAQIEVVASQAGSQITCRCGRQVAVPKLSQLRQTVGKGAYEASTFDTINRMIARGELPANDFCVLSGLPTKKRANVHVACERSYVWKSGQGGGYLGCLIMFISWPIALLYWMMHFMWERGTPPELRGHDRGISLPIPIHDAYREQLERSSAFALRKMLREVPVYAQLLDEYPRAEVRVLPG